jgi:hypothetical protein
MKPAASKQKNDDSLFGLLAAYKTYVTYLRLLISEKEKKIVVQMTENPGNWLKNTDEKYKNFRVLRRLEIGAAKLSIKYLLPEHILKIIGITLGIDMPVNSIVINNNIDQNGILTLEASIKYKTKILHAMNRLLKISPQKKYEILEKCLSESQV